MKKVQRDKIFRISSIVTVIAVTVSFIFMFVCNGVYGCRKPTLYETHSMAQEYYELNPGTDSFTAGPICGFDKGRCLNYLYGIMALTVGYLLILSSCSSFFRWINSFFHKEAYFELRIYLGVLFIFIGIVMNLLTFVSTRF